MIMKTLTIRLPENVYNEMRHIAHNRKESLNKLVCRALETIACKEKEKELYDAFGLIADDPDSNVSFIEATMWEAIHNSPSE